MVLICISLMWSQEKAVGIQRGWRTFSGGRVPKLPINFEEICPCAHWNFEEKSKVLEPSIIFINSSIIIIIIIIINSYYNYTMNTKYNYYISDEGLPEECDEEENVLVTGGPLLLPL